MITVEKLEKGTYFDDAFKISFRYDPTTVAKVKELAERRYLPEDRAWEIPAHELPALIEKVGLSNIKSEEAVVQALNTKEIEDKREATQERLKGIKPVRDFDFKTAPLPHQIEAFNYGMEKNSLLIGDEQGLGKTKESIDICVARKKELIKTLIVCGVNSVKYNWEKEIQIHSNEGCVMVDGKTMDVRVQQLNDWYRGSSYFGVINIESLRNEKIQDALYLGIKDGYIGAIIVDEIHKAKNGGSQQGKALRFLKAPVKIGLSGTPMNKAEDLWNILTWLGVERRSFYSFRNAYCTMGGFGGYKVIGYKNLDSLNAELNTVMLRRKKEEVLDLPPKLYSTEYVELTTAQKKQYRDIKNGIVADMENILASVNPLNCTLRLRQLTSGNPNLTDDSPKLRKQILEANGGHTEADLQRELSRKSKLLDAYLDGILNKQEYQKKAEELDERIIQLKAETEKNKANSGDIAEIDKVLANIDEEVSRYVDGNEKLKVEYLLEHLEQVQIFPDKVIVIVPILSEGIVVEKTQYVSREKRCRKIYDHEHHDRLPGSYRRTGADRRT